jgi:dienelactone hydrolase
MRVRAILRALFGILLCGIPVIAQAADYAKPTGRHAVGRMVLQLKDDDRPEPWTESPRDARQMTLVIWYPAKATADAATSPYIPEISKKVPPMLALENARAKKMKIYTVAGGPPVAEMPKKFPVLFFSPGGDVSPFGYASIVEDLASHGYVVVGIDHVYEGKGQVLTDGTVVSPIIEKVRPPMGDTKAQADFYRKRVEIRAGDVKSAMATIRMMNSRGPDAKFHGRLDLDRIGVFGHSIGGVAVGSVLWAMPEVKAGVNIDGMFMGMPYVTGTGESEAPAKPFMYLGKPLSRPVADEKLQEWKMTREQHDQNMRRQEEQHTEALKKIEGGAYRVIIEGAEHSDFSDEPYLAAKTEGVERRERVTEMTRKFLKSFFNKTLAGREAPALTAAQEGLEGIKVEVFE